MMIRRLSMLTLAAWGGTIASLGAQQAGPALYRVTTRVVVELPGVIRLEGDTISGPIIASDGRYGDGPERRRPPGHASCGRGGRLSDRSPPAPFLR